MSFTTTLAFGPLLKHLRKQAGMTQRDLAAALGYSESFISSLEKAHRQPDIQAVTARFIPALGLQDDPYTAASLIEQAALARGERPPVSVTLQRTAQLVVTETFTLQSNHLPAPPTALLGRDQTVNALCNRLQGHSGRLLTLVGLPGVGKTTLALAVAKQMQHHYRNGAHFVPLAAVSDSMLMASSMIATVAPGDASAKPPQNRLIELLRRQSLLMVLDNLEQIADAAPLIATLLSECAGLTILATSRERLHLRAEQRYKVPPLDLAPAVELFVQRAQAVSPDFTLTAEDEPAVQQVCRYLGYLPLAIELSAAWVHVLSCAEIAKEIERNLHFLTTTLRDVPERHRSLYAVFDHSWQLLSLEEQTAFARLSVFRDRFTHEAAAHVAGATLSVLSSLIDKSLLRRNVTRDYEIHEYGRQFAAAKLQERRQGVTVQQRHDAYFETVAKEVLHQLRSTILPMDDFGGGSSSSQNKQVTNQTPLLRQQTGVRMLMLSWEYPPYIIGGSGKHVAELVPILSQSMLSDRPVVVDVLTAHLAGGQREEQISSTLAVKRIEMPANLRYPFTSAIPHNALLIEQVNDLVQRHQYDLIHIQDWRFTTIGITLKHQWHVPLIATFHLLERMRYQQTLPDQINQVEHLERDLANEAAQIIVCSQFMRQELHNHFGIAYDKISVIANGVKAHAGDQYPSAEQKTLRQKHAPTGQKLLFFIGSALLEKGLSVLIRAMPGILAEHPNTRLLVAGRHCDKLLPFAYALNVEKAIDFLGYVSDHQRDSLYQIVDALIIPSLYEPFGIVALEAMALGCNVIASNVGGLGEVVKDKENGLTVRPNEPQDIVHAVDLLFADPVAAQQRRVHALNEIHTLYSWNKVAMQTVQVYHNLVSIGESYRLIPTLGEGAAGR